MTTKEPIVSETRPQPAPAGPHAGRRALVALFVILGLVLVMAIVLGLLPRLSRQKALLAASQATEERRPAVNVAAVRLGPARSEVELPGDLVALVETPIYARADVFMRRRLVDLGHRVKQGDLMAELETPELDEQIRQARAMLSQSQAAVKQWQASLLESRANLKLAQVTYERWKQLAASGVVSLQDADEKQASEEVRQAEVAAAEASLNAAQNQVSANEANLRRLEELKSFSKITAPFDGVVTYRVPDVGTLINAGSTAAGKEMFRVAQIHILRIFVNVPQSAVPSIHSGQTAELRVQEFPGRVFPASVRGTSHSLDTGSRTELVVLIVPNPDGILLPGMYAQVKFVVERDKPALLIRGDAMVLARSGPQVAVVGADGRVHFRGIQIARDLGAELEINAGLSPGDQVVLHPGDEVRENAVVELRNSSR
ncbi:MAG: efflux RND transporter periplasmic adaptor subunit [Acidobacteria bacterium]|nr:efflux RND transporter periplasmic adaptor subunit [Acidobacteriota bacterium]